MKNEVKSSEIKNVSPAKHFDETFLKFDAQTFLKFVIAIASLVVLAALCTTASAGGYGSGCPFSNWYNGTVHGGIYIDIKGHYDEAGVTQTYTFENVPDGRKIVRLYPGIWLGSPSPGRVTNWSLTINGNLENFNFTEPSSLPFCDWDIPPEDGTGEHCKVSCSGCGVCSLTYNASPYIVTGTNTITYWTSEQIYHVALLVVYENESMPEMQYWIKEGHEKPDSEPYFVYFNETVNTGPIDPDNISSVEYYTCGYPHCVGGESGWPYLNDNYIDACDYVYSYDASGDVYEGSSPGKEFEVLYSWKNIPPGYITSPSNHFRYPTLGNDRLMVPVLVLKYAPKLPDLVITDTWVNWPTNCTICYNLMNTGTVTAPALHNTTLYVDGTRIVNETVPVNLAPGESYIGCFEDYKWVYTPPGNNITVCADSNNAGDEGMGESNNCKTNWWKCGDVNNDEKVRLSDGRRIYLNLTYPGQYPIHLWAADVNNDKKVRLSDGRRIYLNLTYPGQYPLNCQCSG